MTLSRTSGRPSARPAAAGAGTTALALAWLGALAGAFGVADARALERSTIVFGGDAANPPFEWLDGDTARGFGVELARAIAEAGGVEAEHRLSTWPEALRALESGRIDVVTMYHSPERDEDFLFTPPFHFVHHAVYGRPDSPAGITLSDLEGHRIAVERNSYAQRRLLRDGAELELSETQSALMSLEAIRDGRVDYAVIPTEIADGLIDRHGLAISRVSAPLWSLGFAFAVPKANRALAGWLTERYYDLIRDGTYEALYARWESRLDPRAGSKRDRLLETAVFPTAALALLGMGTAIRLRKSIVLQSRELAEESKKRQAAEFRARWLSEHNANTDFPRLPHFVSRVESLMAKAGSGGDRKLVVALKVADVDKTILAQGHEAGMKLAQDCARWLRSLGFEAYGQDGNDVFLLFGDKRKILSKLSSLASPDDTAILKIAHARPRFFAGAATWNGRSKDLTELLRRSAAALAKATEAREPWVEYRPSMEPDKHDLELIEAFRRSAGEDLYPVFQPQVDIHTGRIVGAEALVRWSPPGIGLVPPDKFIPLIEDAGLIRHVTRRMIREALRVAAALRNRGLPCPISVNMSISDLMNFDFPAKLHDTIETVGAQARDIKLELTETSFSRHSSALLWSMMQISDKGIPLSIDDFGTGYSSLAYLSDLPVTEVKIDRSFIRGMRAKAKSRSIVRSTIEMGHDLGLTVVAEGVESDTELEMLRALDCDRIQGFLVAEPMSEEEFVEFVARIYKLHH